MKRKLDDLASKGSKPQKRSSYVVGRDLRLHVMLQLPFSHDLFGQGTVWACILKRCLSPRKCADALQTALVAAGFRSEVTTNTPTLRGSFLLVNFVTGKR